MLYTHTKGSDTLYFTLSMCSQYGCAIDKDLLKLKKGTEKSTKIMWQKYQGPIASWFRW